MYRKPQTEEDVIVAVNLTWSNLFASEDVAKFSVISFVINNKGYAGLGYLPSGNFVNRFLEYDPTTDAWTQKAPFPIIFTGNLISFVCGGKGYVFTVDTSQLFSYDPSTDTWTEKTALPAAPLYYLIGSFVSMNRAYIVIYGALWEYDPIADIWTQKTACPGTNNTNTGFCFSVNNKGYAGGGGGTPFVNDLWEYDPATDTWTQKANIPNGVSIGYTGATASADKGYVSFGYSYGQVPVNSVWEYDPSTDAWTKKASLPDAVELYKPIMFLFDNNIYVGWGGVNGLPFSLNFYKYDIVTDTWIRLRNAPFLSKLLATMSIHDPDGNPVESYTPPELIYIDISRGLLKFSKNHPDKVFVQQDKNNPYSLFFSDTGGSSIVKEVYISNIGTAESFKKILGLSLENHVEDDIVRDAAGNKTSSILYSYDSAANAAAHDKATGLLAKYNVSATYINNKMKLFKSVKA